MTAVGNEMPSLIRTAGIYEGKFVDRAPDTRTAGKLTYLTGESAVQCLTTPKRPPSPPVIRRFRDYFRSDPAEERVFYGTARDPHRVWAKELRHGKIPPLSESLKKTVNPDPRTLFQQKIWDKKESLYESHKLAPLGRAYDQEPHLPVGLNRDKFAFGMRSKLDIGAGKIINPNKGYKQVYEESQIGAELYKKTHCVYDSGEQMTRSYTEPAFLRTNTFGEQTPHYVDGRHVRKTLQWTFDKDAGKETPLSIKRVDDFLEKTKPQIGKVLDPNLETRGHLPTDHTFGIMLKTDGYGAGDLVHCRFPREYLRGRERERGLVSAIRQGLKKNNYQNFHDLWTAFRAYDQDNKGCIDINDLREACKKYDLPVETDLLEQLLDYCDVSKSGVINYVEFANFLNWRDRLPSGLPNKCETLETEGVIQPGDLVSKSPRKDESTPRRLQKQIDRAMGSQKTSANMINAVVGAGGISTREYRSYGLPSVRTDIPAPLERRVNDHVNYGDESDMNGLVNPSLYSNCGVHDVDLLKPRTKEQLLEIFTNIGVTIPSDTMASIYEQVSATHPRGHVSVESFRAKLDILGMHQKAVHEDALMKYYQKI